MHAAVEFEEHEESETWLTFGVNLSGCIVLFLLFCPRGRAMRCASRITEVSCKSVVLYKCWLFRHESILSLRHVVHHNFSLLRDVLFRSLHSDRRRHSSMT